jgi:hypothetical protein
MGSLAFTLDCKSQLLCCVLHTPTPKRVYIQMEKKSKFNQIKLILLYTSQYPFLMKLLIQYKQLYNKFNINRQYIFLQYAFLFYMCKINM